MKNTIILNLALVLVIACLLAMVPTATGKIIFVDADATGANDGSTWTDAYRYLQNGLAAAWSGDEIWVAQGIYKPDLDSRNRISPSGDRTATFQLENGVAVKGGYAGFGEPNPNARDLDAHETILSGDLTGDDGPNFSDYGDNSYHVVTGRGTNSTAVLDGFIITGGNANSSPPYYGGAGMYNSFGSPTLTNCTFSRNRADGGGGAISYFDSRAIISNCTFSGNLAHWGGGIWNSFSSLTLINCTFTGNSAGLGGGLFNTSDRGSTLINCMFSGNSAGDKAGGMWNYESSPTLINCTFCANSAISHGGGMYNRRGAVVLTNCILWGNAPSGSQITLREGSTLFVSYSDVQGGRSAVQMYAGTVLNWGHGNISANPMFVDFASGDYHLLPDSPCIDAGNNTAVPADTTDLDGDADVSELIPFDLDGYPRFVDRPDIPDTGNPPSADAIVDIGTYEFPSTLMPTLQISPTEFESIAYIDGANPDTQILSIRNVGPGTLSWELTEDCPWLEVCPTNGDSAGEIDEVTLSVDISELTPGSYNCELAVVADGALNSPQIVEVSLIVQGPFIELFPMEFEFIAAEGGTNPDSQILTICNSGGGTLNWAIAYDCDWLEVIPTAGSSTGEVDEVTLSVNISGLDPRTYNCELTITADEAVNSPQTVIVNLYVHDDELHVPSEYVTIQIAIDAAWEGDTVIVAPGIYTGAGNREIDFRGKTITVRSIEPNDPNVVAATMIDCYHRYYEYRGFYFHSGEGRDSRLEGFTIANGRKSTWGGAGIYCRQSSPTISNCVFTDNYAYHGGGMYCTDSNSVLINCKFIENSAYRSGGGICAVKSNLTLINCIFNINSAGFGGAMYNSSHYPGWPRAIINATTHWDDRINNSYNSPTLVHCTFMANSAGYGGAIANVETSPKFTNCIFIANKAQSNGGGMYNLWDCSPMLTNCTFAGNSALNGDALACESYVPPYPSNVQITNCILWDGGGEIWNNDASTITITYSDVQGGWPGEGNIDADPYFVSAGYWDTNDTPTLWDDFWVAGDYHLLPDSPCIDAGDPNYIVEPNETDLDGKPRVIGGQIDMGAFEYSPPIPAEVRIVPRTINLASRGKWITSLFWLPEDYDVADIDSNSVLLEFLDEEIQAESILVDEQQQVAVARFSRSEVQGILNVGEAELTITGQLTDGNVFEGTDVIRVIDKGKKK